ncbi:hypothetical protein [Thermoflexus hugenholtzii]|uniref:Uncharacterized protein n=1 Tax=Thermoflexus hugenholtzii JAD2 TaxID=877466 RepID=A0A212RTU7_9CHLR|nr:hypothetical protein [Thermoflexus hugenholtzii]SNB76114.1 hypothetical protein SAMN02746019_00028160 [Thermoflexus hugenholtzii JAD2]
MPWIPARSAERARRQWSFRRARGDPNSPFRIFAFLLRRGREVWHSGSQRLQSLRRPLSPKWASRLAFVLRTLRLLWNVLRAIDQIYDVGDSLSKVAELLNQALQMLR